MKQNKGRKEPETRPIATTYSEEKSEDNDEQVNGHRVQGVEPGNKVWKDGKLQVSDRIVEINQQNLVHVDFPEAQNIFRNALQSSEIQHQLGKKSNSFLGCLSPSSESIKSTLFEERIDVQRKNLQEDGEKGTKSDRISTPINTVSFGQKNVLLASNTRKMGRKFKVQLIKGPDGLGFSITTRDNPALGFCPIYIKNILPKGAAVKDGRLKPGDRLLKVNQVEVTGLSQAEAVAILKNVSPGSVVNLLVSRQDVDVISNLPRKIPPEKASDAVNINPWQYKEVFTFDIPLNDTGSAGLGISVKGHTSVTHNGPVDFGIFIKSIIHGGAASKDGRLKADDQLLSINGISLVNMTNTEALKTVRKTMTQNEGPNVHPGAISLTVARMIVSPSIDEVGNENDGSSFLNDLNNLMLSSGGDSRCGSANGSFIHNSFAETEDRVSVEPSKNIEDGMSLNHRTVCTLNCNLDFDENMNQRESKCLEKKNLIFDSPVLSIRNPVVDRLTEQGYYSQIKPKNTLHSESYLCASHENWSDHQLYHASCDLIKSDGYTDMDTTQSVVSEEANKPLYSTSHPESSYNLLFTLENEDKKNDKLESKATQNNRDSLISSLDEDSFNLSRDGIGRRSVSEKRHAKLDATKTNTFKRNKQGREDGKHKEQYQRNDPEQLTRHLQIADLQYKQSAFENTHCRDQSLDKIHADAKENENVQKMPLEVKPLIIGKKSSNSESTENVQKMPLEVKPLIIGKKSSNSESTENVQELKKDKRSEILKDSSAAAVKNTDGEEHFSTTCQSPEVAVEVNNQSENGSLASIESYGCSPLAAVLNRPSVSSDRTPDDVLSPDYKFSKNKKKSLLKGLGSMFKFGKNKTSKVSGKSKEAQSDELKKKREEKNKTKESFQEYQEKIPETYWRVAYRDKQNQVFYGSARYSSMNCTRSFAPITKNMCQEQEQHVLCQPDPEKEDHYMSDKKEMFHETQRKEPLVQQPPRYPLPQVYAQFCQPRRILPKVFTSHRSHPALIQRAQSLRCPDVKSAFSEQRDSTDVLHNRSCRLETSAEDKIDTQLNSVTVNHYNSQNELQQQQQLQHRNYQQLHFKGQQLQSLHLRHHTEPLRQLSRPTSNFRRDRSASACYRIGKMQPKCLPTNRSSHTTCVPAQISQTTNYSLSSCDHHYDSTVQPNVCETPERWTVYNIGFLDRHLMPHYSLEKDPSLKHSPFRSHQDTRIGY
ncbi:uncharacterized protein LOC143234356 isoform X2 [Tachypleus tridentatus]|uniref:uncharacterized protein LOC143234356 isoform X2 n=1 Tax=Tachypleus tridentatus TaxID=6853 RepID=UPI003FD59110